MRKPYRGVDISVKLFRRRWSFWMPYLLTKCIFSSSDFVWCTLYFKKKFKLLVEKLNESIHTVYILFNLIKILWFWTLIWDDFFLTKCILNYTSSLYSVVFESYENLSLRKTLKWNFGNNFPKSSVYWMLIQYLLTKCIFYVFAHYSSSDSCFSLCFDHILK